MSEAGTCINRKQSLRSGLCCLLLLWGVPLVLKSSGEIFDLAAGAGFDAPYKLLKAFLLAFFPVTAYTAHISMSSGHAVHAKGTETL